MIVMMKVIICEDDMNHLQLNKEYIERTLQLIGQEYQIRTYAKAESIEDEDVKWANTAFLDIDLGVNRMSGISFAQRAIMINKWIAVVFITSYQEYTMDAFRIQAFGYIEKPILKNELKRIMEKLVKYIKDEDTSKFLEVFDNRKQTLIKLDDIIYIEKIGRKVMIFTMIKDICVAESITTLEGRLNANFLKANQGTIVNKRYVNRLEGDTIYMTTMNKVKVSRSNLKGISGELNK